MIDISPNFPKCSEKLISYILSNSHLPIKKKDKAVAVDMEFVGTNFEPRFKVEYNVYCNDVYQGKCESTFIFDKYYTKLINVIDSRKI